MADLKISVRNGQLQDKYRWPNKTIPYEFDQSQTTNQQALIEHAMKLLEKYSCVKFVKRTNEKGYLKFRVSNQLFFHLRIQSPQKF